MLLNNALHRRQTNARALKILHPVQPLEDSK